MLRTPEEGSKVDGLFTTVVEPESKTIISRLLDTRDVYDGWVHGSCLVIFLVSIGHEQSGQVLSTGSFQTAYLQSG